MGDRTSVTLTFPEEHVATVLAIYDRERDDCDDFLEGLLSLEFEEVNYGNLWDLEKLQAAGIAYDARWGTGCEYGPGEYNCRFTPEGDIERSENADSNENPDLGALLTLIDQPVELRQFILDHKAAREVRSWDNQVFYGKVYRTWQLITPADMRVPAPV